MSNQIYWNMLDNPKGWFNIVGCKILNEWRAGKSMGHKFGGFGVAEWPSGLSKLGTKPRVTLPQGHKTLLCANKIERNWCKEFTNQHLCRTEPRLLENLLLVHNCWCRRRRRGWRRCFLVENLSHHFVISISLLKEFVIGAFFDEDASSKLTQN